MRVGGAREREREREEEYQKGIKRWQEERVSGREFERCRERQRKLQREGGGRE